MAKHDEARSQLEQRLQQLTNRAGRIESDLRQTPSSDWEEQAIELENEEVLQRLDEGTLDEVKQIRLALERIAAGTYGTCSKCGQDISEARLAAIPSTTTCVGCAA